MNEILNRLENVGLFAAARKCEFLALKLSWCENVFSSCHVSYDPDGLHGPATTRRPRMAGEFSQATNWMQTSVQKMAQVVKPLRVTLEQGMSGAPKRAANVANGSFPTMCGPKIMFECAAQISIQFECSLPVSPSP